MTISRYLSIYSNINRNNIHLLTLVCSIISYQAYASYSGDFSPHLLHQLERSFNETNTLFSQLIVEKGSKSTATPIELLHIHRRVFEEYQQFMRRITDICREMWVSFDIGSMIFGMGILVSSLLLLGYQLVGRPSTSIITYEEQTNQRIGKPTTVEKIFIPIIHSLSFYI